MAEQPVEGVRYEQGASTPVRDNLVVEAPLEICINGRPFSMTMRTPGDDIALVKGLLFSEGVVNRKGLACDILTEPVPRRAGAVRASVQIPPVYVCDKLLEKRVLISSASCGLCGKQDMDGLMLDGDPLPPDRLLDLDLLPEMAAAMLRAQGMFASTGGSHAAAAFRADGEILSCREDIGRHNAVDKVIGSLLEAERLAEAYLLFVSGRVSFEIVAKAQRAGIPFLAAVSAPSSMAVDLGTRWGMTLLGFCRGNRATIYSHPERVRQGRAGCAENSAAPG